MHGQRTKQRLTPRAAHRRYTGTAPWHGLQLQQIMKAVCIDRRAPEVPPEAPAADLLRRCLARAPGERPRAAELARAFAPSFEPPPAVPVVAQLELCEERCEQLRAENEGLKREQEGLKRENEGLKREQEGLKRENEGLKREQEGLKQGQAALTRENEGLKQEQAALTRENEGLTREQAALTRRLGELERELQAQQEITVQVTAALTAKTLEAEGHVAAMAALEEQVRRAAASSAPPPPDDTPVPAPAGAAQAPGPLLDRFFDLASLADQLGKPGGVHDVLAEACLCAQSLPAHAGEGLLQLCHFLGRHLRVFKAPPVDLRQTVLQLACQEPPASRVRRAAEATLRAARQGGRNLIEWTNKHRGPLPCVMDMCEHSEPVYAVAVSPDGKLIASGSADKTVVVVEAATGRVRWRLRGHRCHVCSIFV